MTEYLISFPSEAMIVPDGDWEAVSRDSHAVVQEAKAAGVYVFAGGIDEDVSPVVVAADGRVTAGTYPGVTVPSGGYCVLELPSRETALEWAAKLAVACRCSQEVRQFQYDPESSPSPAAPPQVSPGRRETSATPMRLTTAIRPARRTTEH